MICMHVNEIIVTNFQFAEKKNRIAVYEMYNKILRKSDNIN